MNENEIGSVLNNLLSDPGALSGIMQMAGSLLGNADKNDTEQKSTEVSKELTVPQEDTQSSTEAQLPDLSVLAGLLGNKSKHDPRCELLSALRPFVNSHRSERIDQLIKLLRIADAASGFLSSGILNERK